MPILSLNPEELSQPLCHHYLLSAVAPRPICFASTIDASGRVNLSPYSFFNVFSSNPPILVFSPSRSGRDGKHKHTFENIQEVKEVVINIVNFPMVEQMSLSSTAYDKGVNEFVKAGFTEVPSETVRPPRVAESPVSFECQVQQVIELGQEGGAGNLMICRVLYLHLDEAYLNEEKRLDTQKLDLVARLGGSWYGRMIPEALFEIPRPLREQGIGVDQLPKSVRSSTVLTGNDLGRLGNSKQLPDAHAIEEIAQEPEVKQLSESSKNFLELGHRLAQQWLATGETERALALVLWLDLQT